MQEIYLSGCAATRIQLYDVDPLGIVWHGNYFRFFEIARWELFQKIGFDFFIMESSGYLWPIVDFRVKYQAPLTLHQAIVTKAYLVEYEHRLKINYEIFDKNNPSTLYTKAQSIQIAVKKGCQEGELVSPPCLTERVESFLKKSCDTQASSEDLERPFP